MSASPFDTTKSAALYQRACQSLATGVSSGLRRSVTPVPLYFDRADGPYYYGVDGHELVDYTLAWGPLIVGSNHPAVNAAVVRQLGRGYAFGAQHAAEAELAELMIASVPAIEQVIFSNTGTEAVQAALRLARAFTGRSKFIKFEGHYHGWLNNVLVSYRPKGADPFTTEPTCGGQPASEFAETITLPWNDLPALERTLANVPGIAAVITEPILANSGCVMPRDGFLAGVIAACKRHGVVSIFDEVITGFRLALGGAREHFGLSPDLSVYGKAMAGGFAMSAVGGRREIFDVLRDGRTIHAGTYNGNCINIAAAIATIKVLREPGTYQRMNAHGAAIRAAIEKAAKDTGQKLLTTGVGSVFGVHFNVDAAPTNYREATKTDMATYTKLRAELLARGVHLLPDGRWYVGAAHTDKELAKVIPAIEQAMKAIASPAAATR
jgi:glutamate-1-semialdehyde 2,1-aminomutase